WVMNSHPASATKRNGSPFCCSRYFPWVLKWSGHATLEPAAFAAATAAIVPAASAPLGLTISASWAATTCVLARSPACLRLRQVDHRRGDPLCTLALGRSYPLPRRRPHRDRLPT